MSFEPIKPNEPAEIRVTNMDKDTVQKLMDALRFSKKGKMPELLVTDITYDKEDHKKTSFTFIILPG